jgi:hypothetical protein
MNPEGSGSVLPMSKVLKWVFLCEAPWSFSSIPEQDAQKGRSARPQPTEAPEA